LYLIRHKITFYLNLFYHIILSFTRSAVFWNWKKVPSSRSSRLCFVKYVCDTIRILLILSTHRIRNTYKQMSGKLCWNSWKNISRKTKLFTKTRWKLVTRAWLISQRSHLATTNKLWIWSKKHAAAIVAGRQRALLPNECPQSSIKRRSLMTKTMRKKEKRKLLQWLVFQQTEELDIKVKCKMIHKVYQHWSKVDIKYMAMTAWFDSWEYDCGKQSTQVHNFQTMFLYQLWRSKSIEFKKWK